ncbi:hypothetical protein IAQ61_010846 [Plenodomus lingam]|nr:hypothetical protein IAQ61_010846 [Plenodomus lingam]
MISKEQQPPKSAADLSKRVNELLEIESQYAAGGVYPLPTFIASGKGSILKDVDGNEIIDFIQMMSATNLGQCHPKIVEAVIKSAQEITLSNIATKTATWPEFCKMMCERFGYDRIISSVSGSEAADAAVKFARRWGIKAKGIDPRETLVLGVSDNYHGMSAGIWPIMNDMGQGRNFGIFNENLTNRNPTNGKPLRYCHLEDFEEVFASCHGRIAAVIMECIHGKKPTFKEELDFATGVRKLCAKYNAIFIADEIRMGAAKTGKFLCSDWMGPENKPDMVIMGKSITAGAYPASYVIGTDKVMGLINAYENVATFGMTPMGIATTKAALQVYDDENLLERALWIGDLWTKATADWKHPHLDYTTCRGADLQIYFKGVDNIRAYTRRFGMLCLHKGLLCYPDGERVRLGVALNIPEDELRRGIAILKEALDEVDESDEVYTGPPMKGEIPDM